MSIRKPGQVSSVQHLRSAQEQSKSAIPSKNLEPVGSALQSDDLYVREAAYSSHPVKHLFERMFPDKVYDGQIQDLSEQKVLDFGDVMKLDDPLGFLASEVAYRPEGSSAAHPPLVFIPGLGQRNNDAQERGKFYADTLQTPWVQLHNASFLKEKPIFAAINSKLDWLDAGVHRMGMLDSPVIENTSELIHHSLTEGNSLNLSADSHGTILLARSLKRAKRQFIEERTKPWDLEGRAREEKNFERLASEHINVMTFGNGHDTWVKGPNYLHVSIEGDPLPEKFGLTPEKMTEKGISDPNTSFLTFDRMFPEGNFEAHNMKFTTQLLRQSLKNNGLADGDIQGLFEKVKDGTFVPARPDEVVWPEMSEHFWDSSLDMTELLEEYKASTSSQSR